jgi:hypothetical protein
VEDLSGGDPLRLAGWVVLDEWHVDLMAFPNTSAAEAERLRDLARLGLAALLRQLVSQGVTVSIGV